MLELALIKFALLYMCVCYVLSRFKLFRPPRGSLGFGGGGSSGTSTSTTTQELSPEQRELLALVIPEAQRISAAPPQLFPGTAIAGFNPLQQLGQQQAVSAATGPVQQVADVSQGAFNFLQGPVLFPETNPALGQAIAGAVRPLQQTLTEVALPAIRQEAITSGGFGGSRQGIAEGRAIEGTQRAIGDVSAGLANQGFQSGLNALVQGLALAPDVAGLQLGPAQAIEAVGSQIRALEQAQLSEEAQRFLSEQLVPFSVAQDIAALAFGVGGGSSTTRGNTTGPGNDPLNTILGIASLFGGFFF